MCLNSTRAGALQLKLTRIVSFSIEGWWFSPSTLAASINKKWPPHNSLNVVLESGVKTQNIKNQSYHYISLKCCKHAYFDEISTVLQIDKWSFCQLCIEVTSLDPTLNNLLNIVAMVMDLWVQSCNIIFFLRKHWEYFTVYELSGWKLYLHYKNVQLFPHSKKIISKATESCDNID